MFGDDPIARKIADSIAALFGELHYRVERLFMLHKFARRVDRQKIVRVAQVRGHAAFLQSLLGRPKCIVVP
jgi:hypothetical protein